MKHGWLDYFFFSVGGRPLNAGPVLCLRVLFSVQLFKWLEQVIAR